MSSPTATSESLEYLADVHDIASPAPERRTRTDPHEAAGLLLAAARARIGAVLAARPGPSFVLLSGGVDSILVAAVAAALGHRPHAITVVTADNTDGPAAAAAAAALHLPHTVVRLADDEVVDLAGDVIGRLGTAELWEVTAAIPVLAAARVCADTPAAAVLTGSGADAVFAGGRPLRHRLDSPAAVAELDRVVRAEAAANFTRRRLVPHFYHALLGARAEHLIHVFQTAAFWTIAETLAPQALFGVRDGRPVDKLCLRLACESLLDPPARQLAWTAKDPIQRSTGLMSVLAAAAREHAATLPGARTYSDPRGEPFETIATRLYLALLAARVNPPTERRVHRD